MSTADLTPSEMFESLTGFDEIAVRKAFGANITDFARKDGAGNPMMFGRALVFVHRRRQGDNDPTAYTAAMTMTIGESQDYFLPDADEPAEGDDLEDDAEGKAPSA